MAKSSALRAEAAAGRPLRTDTGDGMEAERANHIANPAIPDLDRLIHERIRLGIVSALAANSTLTFNDLKRLLKTTDGNLSVHARTDARSPWRAHQLPNTTHPRARMTTASVSRPTPDFRLVRILHLPHLPTRISDL